MVNSIALLNSLKKRSAKVKSLHSLPSIRGTGAGFVKYSKVLLRQHYKDH